MPKIVKPAYRILTPICGNSILKHIEPIARTCYKSEDKITEDGESAKKIVKNLIKLGHEAMIEHASISVCFTADLGFYKDITRHRIASFAIESTRYCMYANDKFGNEICVMEPPFVEPGTPDYDAWHKAIVAIEKGYLELAAMGHKPDMCRMLLPHSSKADINLTCNLREWRHIFKLRASVKAHATIHSMMRALLKEFKRHIPIIFDDIEFDDAELSDWAKKTMDDIDARCGTKV
ncbi:MAG: FAD-dependent thymidylate synthase [Alphaproteobacteria bacterium]|nr:FAD-dependent thymidylate synthase [Alphaproteobacteria bacterium]